jgi:hypothetical protein
VPNPARLQPLAPPARARREPTLTVGSSRTHAWTPNHIAILEWAEPRQGTEGHVRPEIPGVSPYRVDELVADLIGHGLLKGVAVPRHPRTNVPAHWEPTVLTVDGKKWLFEHRRQQPKPAAAGSWWSRLLGLTR